MKDRLSSSLAVVVSLAAISLVPIFAQAPQTGNVPTPRTADSHPDLSGIWIAPGPAFGGILGGGVADNGDIAVQLNGRTTQGAVGQPAINFERDNHLTRRMDPNKPLYKPEYWTKIQETDLDNSNLDPEYSCMPDGVPRLGVPNRIIQLPKETVFLYSASNGDIFREIPTDGRPHTPEKELEGTWMGEGLGQWDGDTFVVDSVGFTDASWLYISGYVHSENMHVVERLTRTGNQLRYQATVEDPMFIKPWLMNPMMRVLNPNPKAILGEGLPCSEKDLPHLATKENH